MKSNFKYFAIVWAIVVAIFNAIVFVTPNEWEGMSKFAGAFWVGYIFIMLSLVGQLIIAWFSLKNDAQKLFYRISILSISYISLGVMLVVGTLCMVIPNFPIWLGIILCLCIVAFSLISMMQAQASTSVIEEIDTKVKVKTLFIKTSTIEAESLMLRASTEEIKKEIKKICDSLRYSDPMSNDALSGIESQITIKFNELSEKVTQLDEEGVRRLTSEILILVKERNSRCKLLK